MAQHVTKFSNWFLQHENEFTVLQWPPKSPDLNPAEYLWDVVENVETRNLHQLCDPIMSICTKIYEEFYHKELII